METLVEGGKFLSRSSVGTGGRPLWLLHGFLGSGRNLGALARRLVERDPSLTVVLPDLTGHGDSPALDDGDDLRSMARDVLATAAALGHTGAPLRLVGHSLGGRVAPAAAQVAPGAVEAVTLLDIAPSPIVSPGADSVRLVAALVAAPREADSREVLREHLRAAGVPAALVDWQMLNVHEQGGAWRWKIDAAALAALHPRVNAADLWSVVEGGRVRVHAVRGGRSSYVSDADMARLEAAGASVRTLPEAGHFLHVEALPALIEALVQLGVAA
jgi:pimeloyl-ACP methyl ester carboxylesterase